MNQPSWKRISALFAAALEFPEPERRSYVEREAGDDVALRDEVLSLIECDSIDRALGVEAHLFAHVDHDAVETVALLIPGTRLGPFEVTALAGEGGMGEVYRAERVDGSYHQTVAIKVLRTGFLTAETLRRFRLEREVLARLVHADIAAIHDAGTTPDGRPYLVLQYVDGLPITEYAERHELGVRERLQLFERVALAVHFAHSRLIVHRDLKPSNILVDATGHPRLLDFGVAKLIDVRDADSLALATRPEMRILTPEHAAPEQLRGEAVGTATDIYALGVLLYELLAGQRPFRARGHTPAELERLILGHEPPPPSTVAPASRARQLRGDLDRIVAMAMRKEADRRYASASQFAEDIDRFLTGLPVLAQRDTIAYRARKFVRRNRTLVSSLAVVTLLLAAFAAAMFVQARRLAAERDRAERERAAADDLVGIVTGLFDRANPLLVPGGDTVRVSALLVEADQQIDALADHPDRQARLQRTLGNMRIARGEYERARGYLHAAWQTFAALGDEAETQAALTYHDLANATWHFEGTPVSRAMLDSSVARLRNVASLPRETLAKALLDRAIAQPTVAAQRTALEEVVAIRSEIEADSVNLAALLNAEAATMRGQQAAVVFEDALRILRRLLPPDHPHVITVTGNVAASLITAGEFERADSIARALLDQLPANTPEDARANSEERVALLAAHLGNLDEAERMMRVSLDRLTRAVGPGHWRTGNSLRNLGLIRIARGDLAQGLALLDSAIAHSELSSEALTSATHMKGQRVIPLIRLGRVEDARRALRDAMSIEQLVPRGNYTLADLPFWQGMLALAVGDTAAATLHFDTAHTRRLTSYHGHPKVYEAACAGHVVLRRTGSGAPTPEPLDDACARYAKWGLAEPLLLDWAQAAGLLAR